MSGTGVASYGDLLLTSLVVLAGVCIAAFVVVRVFGRFLATGRTRGAHLLDVIARVPLEPRRSLYVVEVAGKTLLVGTSEMGLSVLSELDGNEVRERAVVRPSFGELVKQAWARRGKERVAVADADGIADKSRHDADGVADKSRHDAVGVADKSRHDAVGVADGAVDEVAAAVDEVIDDSARDTANTKREDT